MYFFNTDDKEPPNGGDRYFWKLNKELSKSTFFKTFLTYCLSIIINTLYYKLPTRNIFSSAILLLLLVNFKKNPNEKNI